LNSHHAAGTIQMCPWEKGRVPDSGLPFRTRSAIIDIPNARYPPIRVGSAAAPIMAKNQDDVALCALHILSWYSHRLEGVSGANI
jgi:hypothetical protein